MIDYQYANGNGGSGNSGSSISAPGNAVKGVPEVRIIAQFFLPLLAIPLTMIDYHYEKGNNDDSNSGPSASAPEVRIIVQHLNSA